MKSVCEEALCTACGACENICPTGCISRQYRSDDSWYYVIDGARCIHCHQCDSVCPNLVRQDGCKPEKAYAAWSTDQEQHKQSASGGIASELYRWALERRMAFAGAYMAENQEVHFRLGMRAEDIAAFQNSKYTFSYLDSIYQEIDQQLKNGNDVLFIGLPCQVAAMKNYVAVKHRTGTMYTADLVCHGTPAPEYLKQHVSCIERKLGGSKSRVTFRNPEYGTQNFAFTVDTEQTRYLRTTDDNDIYQIGYHKALIYRECCYRCSFARQERVGDLTLADYHGLGMESPYNHEKKEVSCVLVNTQNGKRMLDELTQSGRITAYERPVSEPMRHEKQMNHPSIKTEATALFRTYYADCRDYDTAAKKAFAKEIRRNTIRKILHVKKLKQLGYAVIPRTWKEYVKRLLRNRRR